MERVAKFLFVVTVFGLSSAADGELSEQQASYVGRLKTEIDQAARLFQQEEFEKSAAHVAYCQNVLAKLAQGGDAEMVAALRSAHGRLRKAHGLFADRGMELPPLLELGPAGPGGAEQAGSTRERFADQANATISFTRQVAPILVTRCGGCHVSRNMGEFSMATFAVLMQGSENGEVLSPGKPEESPLFDLVQSGEMPPPRPRPRPVPRAEVELIRTWILQGATYDGQREDERLLDVVPPEVARAAAGPGGGRAAPGGSRTMRGGR